MGDPIDELIEEIVIDAYGDDEQLWSFHQAFEDRGRFPFRGRVIGIEADVTGVDYDGDNRRGLVANCRRDGEPYMVSLLDATPAGPMSPDTRRLIDAYRRWANAAPLAPIIHVSTDRRAGDGVEGRVGSESVGDASVVVSRLVSSRCRRCCFAMGRA